MITSMLAFTFLTLLQSHDPVPTELKLFQGVWAAYNAEAEGVPTAREKIARTGLKVDKDKWIVLFEGKPVVEGTLSVDPTADPKTLDVLGPRNSVLLKAIYKIEGNTLTVCYALGKSDRPKELITRPGSQSGLTVYKRK